MFIFSTGLRSNALKLKGLKVVRQNREFIYNMSLSILSSGLFDTVLSNKIYMFLFKL